MIKRKKESLEKYQGLQKALPSRGTLTWGQSLPSRGTLIDVGTVTAEPSSLEAVGRPAAKPDAAEAPEAKSIHDVCGHSAGHRETHLLKDAAAGSESAGMAGRGTESSLWAPPLTGERARGKKTAGVSQQPQWSQKSLEVS